MQLVEARSIFSPATGFIRRGGFDWTCNPYLGCSFGCSYCYAAFLPQSRRPVEEWGKWFAAKANAVELARGQARKVAGQAVYLSSVTDPYQPAERSLYLTRGILEAMLPHRPRLVVQTRGPLVVRDIDLLRQFDAVRVNVSIPTDSDEVRRSFEPKAPPLEKRWLALGELSAAGIPVGICITPTLPVHDAAAFADRVARANADVVVVQEFHAAAGFGADTGSGALAIRAEYRWGADEYRRFVETLRRRVPLFEGEQGFFPPRPAAAASADGGRSGDHTRQDGKRSRTTRVPSAVPSLTNSSAPAAGSKAVK